VAGLFAEGLAFVEGARLHAVGSRARASARAFAERFGVERIHEGYDGLVADPEVDAIYVATPNELHREHCLLAIEAGKPVLCEKPFALDAEEGRAIVAAARRHGVFCMEAMWMRFSPALQEALRLIRAGAIGEPRVLFAQLGFPQRPAPARSASARAAGGALLDLAVYTLSLAQAVLGTPERVQAAAARGATGVDEQVSAILEYSGGRQAVVTASLQAQLGNAAAIHGTEGVIRLDPPLYFPHRLVLARSAPWGGIRSGSRGIRARVRVHPWVRRVAEVRDRLRTRTIVRRARGNGYDAEAAEVGRCLEAGLLESPEMPLADTLAVLETMDAIRGTWHISS
jgi:predicted dehydrogenase